MQRVVDANFVTHATIGTKATIEAITIKYKNYVQSISLQLGHLNLTPSELGALSAHIGERLSINISWEEVQGTFLDEDDDDKEKESHS